MAGQLDGLIHDYSNRNISRRQFVKSAAAIGVSGSLITLLLEACAPVQQTPSPTSAAGASPSAASSASAPGAIKQLTVATPSTPSALDVQLFQGYDVYDAFITLNDTLTKFKQIPAANEPDGFDLDWSLGGGAEITVPRMVDSWDVSPDGRVYTFHLKSGFKSHAGNDFTADDVKYHFDRSFATAAISNFLNGVSLIESPDSIKVVDPQTVEITVREPNPSLLLTMNLNSRAIGDSTEGKANATPADQWANEFFKNKDSGFGPYRLDKLEPGNETVYVAHEGHPYPPKIQQLTFKVVPASSSRLALLSRGEVDVAQQLTPEELRSLEGTPGVKVWNFQGYTMLMIVINSADWPPLDNVKVRQALSYAVPYQSIVDDLYAGYARPAGGCISDHAAGFDPSLFPYKTDLDMAKQLLAEAGFADGFSTWMGYNSEHAIGERVGIALKGSFAQIGVTLELRGMPPAVYDDHLYGKKAPMMYFVSGADSPDPAYALGLWWRSVPDNFVNWGKYSNPEVDRLLAEGAAILDWDQRIAAHKAIQKMIIDDAAWLWIAQPGFQVATRDNITGVNWYVGEAVDWSLVDRR